MNWSGGICTLQDAALGLGDRELVHEFEWVEHTVGVNKHLELFTLFSSITIHSSRCGSQHVSSTGAVRLESLL